MGALGAGGEEEGEGDGGSIFLRGGVGFRGGEGGEGRCWGGGGGRLLRVLLVSFEKGGVVEGGREMCDSEG